MPRTMDGALATAGIATTKGIWEARRGRGAARRTFALSQRLGPKVRGLRSMSHHACGEPMSATLPDSVGIALTTSSPRTAPA